MENIQKKGNFDKSKENIDLGQEIALLKKELEKAKIEIDSVKSLANERVSYLSGEIETTKQVVFAILSGVSSEIQEQDIISDFQDKMKDRVSDIMRV